MTRPQLATLKQKLCAQMPENKPQLLFRETVKLCFFATLNGDVKGVYKESINTDTELAIDPRSSGTVVEFGNTTTALDSELDLLSDTDIYWIPLSHLAEPATPTATL